MNWGECLSGAGEGAEEGEGERCCLHDVGNEWNVMFYVLVFVPKESLHPAPPPPPGGEIYLSKFSKCACGRA